MKISYLRYFVQNIFELLRYRTTEIKKLYFKILYTKYIYNFEIQDTSVVCLLLRSYRWEDIYGVHFAAMKHTRAKATYGGSRKDT